MVEEEDSDFCYNIWEIAKLLFFAGVSLSCITAAMIVYDIIVSL